jgi:hypothetical protein
MPRNVRNFWLEAEVDGRSTSVATGPEGKDGGISVRVLIRREGGVSMAATLRGRALPDGTLELVIVGYDPDGAVRGRVKVESTR